MYQPSPLCVACFICNASFVSFFLLCVELVLSQPSPSTSSFALHHSTRHQQQCQLHQLHQSGIYCVKLLLISPVVCLNDLLAQRVLLSIKNEC
jgi:hypothetical protein